MPQFVTSITPQVSQRAAPDVQVEEDGYARVYLTNDAGQRVSVLAINPSGEIVRNNIADFAATVGLQTTSRGFLATRAEVRSGA